MTPDALLDHCLARPGAFLDYPFSPDVAAVKVKAPSWNEDESTILPATAGVTSSASGTPASVRGWHS